MNASLQQSINTICQTFCEDFGCIDCVEVGKGMHSIVFKATKKDSGKEMCLKIIPELEFNKNREEWNITKLLKKF
jgi:hypothetical protein